MRYSPDRKLRLEIRSPDNDQVAPREPTRGDRKVWGGFQSDFTYSVIQVATDEPLWHRSPDEHDPLFCPNDAWVSNDGQAVVITRSPFTSSLLVLNSSGETIGCFDVASEVLEDNESEFHWTSAGSHWNEQGHGLFLDVDRECYWSFRTQLNRQILIDLRQGTMTDPTEAVIRERRRRQRKWALGTLRAHVDNPVLYGEFFPKRSWKLLRRLWIAVFWCGLDRIRRAVPELQKCERSTVSGGYMSGWKVSGKSTAFVHMYLVRVAQFALRRIGEEPAGYAPYWLCRGTGSPTQKKRMLVPECLTDRPAKLKQLNLGMSQPEVVELVGMPDINGHGWFYDVTASNDESYTLKITWDHRTDTITNIETIPPGWIKWKSRAVWL